MPKRKTITAKNMVNAQLGIRLSSHERLCAERMSQLIKSIDSLKKNVDELKIQVAKGKGAVAVLVFLGTIVAAVFGYFNIR
tara:strand:+ start:45 stop:287 length:243 start_codon:yes stop_codon:yes gene_type:complete